MDILVFHLFEHPEYIFKDSNTMALSILLLLFMLFVDLDLFLGLLRFRIDPLLHQWELSYTCVPFIFGDRARLKRPDLRVTMYIEILAKVFFSLTVYFGDHHLFVVFIMFV